ncbi:MAG: hypothetical protein JWN96_2767 [Mycobacterium sp.]|nr:hypothetical protein [Mycobacterium sp.]
MTTPTPSPPAFYKRRFTRRGTCIAGLATVAAIYPGFSAPGVSPVTPTPTAEAIVGTTQQGTTNLGGTDSTVNFVHHHRGHR